MSANTPKAGITYPSLGDPPNVPANLATLAGQLDGIVIPKYASAAALTAANPTPTAGDMCYRTDLHAYLSYDGTAWDQFGVGAWTTFVPTWTAVTTNPSIGNGTLTSRWCRIGRSITWMGTMAAGTTTTAGSGLWYMSLPVVAASNGITGRGTASYVRQGDAEYIGVSTLVPGGSTIGFVTTQAATPYTSNVSNSFPVTMGSNCSLYWNITYEAAS